MNEDMVVAVDGGNSKTDLALVRANGEALALVRGPHSSPHYVGLDGSLAVIEALLGNALREAGVTDGRGPLARVAQLLMAGVDFPAEERDLCDAATARNLAERVAVANDTFAVLRAGTEKGWGVAVVCGTGINCVGVALDGRHARFPALGTLTGDWGGGTDIGLAAVYAAARSEDGRGPKSVLEQAVPAHFGLETPTQLAEAVHRGRMNLSSAADLAPIVLAAAPADPVAAEILERLADEIVALVRVALQRLELANERVDVLLGGGLFLSGSAFLVGAVEERLAAVAPRATARVTDSPPIVGAALLGLDQLAADADAQARLRMELSEAFTRMENGRKAVSVGTGERDPGRRAR
ncbi:MAG TPA: BadF/BadG/BcrA/BcrD ATPase family protein [Gaiellaceae bacterium]|jgi:N-acetylglucosamine kinase-like BadF-type ATPase|nr:BadF/BadG/BcrA/BcrD ATPase family protein [Gaiellaceae bacterium]